VLADEPTAALDSKTGETILELLYRLNESEHATFLIATHDPKVMVHAKRTIRIADGTVGEKGREEAYVYPGARLVFPDRVAGHRPQPAADGAHPGQRRVRYDGARALQRADRWNLRAAP